jgi:hypothetical protein
MIASAPADFFAPGDSVAAITLFRFVITSFNDCSPLLTRR